MSKKLFIDCGVGIPHGEAEQPRWKDYKIEGLEACTDKFTEIKKCYPGLLLNLAISDKDGFIDGLERHTSFELYEETFNRTPYRKVKKESITIDTLYEKYGDNADEVAIWADIEGSELLMLKGATKLLASGKVKWVMLECRAEAPKTHQPGWCTAKQVYDFLAKYGFEPFIPLTGLSGTRERDIVFTPKGVGNK